MSQKTYNKEQINPFTKKSEVTGTALITEDQAAVLNKHSKKTGVKYVLAPKKTKK